jgi:hypothetical protein
MAIFVKDEIVNSQVALPPKSLVFLLTRVGLFIAHLCRTTRHSLPFSQAIAMATSPLPVSDLDVIEEFKLRRWARENYVPAAGRDTRWHPVVLDEMRSKDSEVNALAG